MASTSKTSDIVTGYLKKIIGHPVGELFSLTSGEKVIIGRHKQAVQIWIQDVNVSRTHCVLKYLQSGWFIKDLKSMNGTYLGGKMLDTEIFHPLKDGVSIHLGPPEEAPAAFIFLTKLSNEQSYEINMNSCNQRNSGGTTHFPILVSYKSIKRPSDPEDSGTNESISPRKKIATSSSSPTTASSRVQGFFEEIEDNDNLSDCSISSLDSLRTRVRKMSAKKNTSRISRNKDTMNAASTSASPHLRTSSNADFESKPSTSAIPAEQQDRKRNKVQKPTISKEFALLNTLFNESESSTPETIKGEEDSRSLLNDSKILFDCEPYPFSQALATESAQTEQNKNKAGTEKMDSVEEQLQKATLEVKKLKKDKLYLSRLVKDLKSEEFLKKKFQVEFQKMLEDELMCNICTEVFMKAITLGCSHTFCEYCISEWKKKQKKCPICREKITSETKILVLDSFISKAVEQLDIGTQNRRKELSATREKAKVTQQKKGTRSRGRNRRIQSESSDADEVRQIRGESSNSIGLQIRFSRNNSPSIQVLQDDDDEFGDMTSDFSDLSDESDMSVGGYGYFGGYGRCYSCGRRGHWANGCPYT
ncbi:E3 ubiquitin-protein ligase rnf8 [Araneus ventricosus]|uniref:E3 ubiquitin-protein ligase CHFR n=1 Tax=Araneus ventricosus TaxID=182803 RepID=A0A4Y2K7P3_ARAVE|nr:E3 ubiquitin-protein ligase rnf8 [Araneus ventricosus]